MKNLVEWFDIATTDIERAKKFYSKVFNLEFQLLDMPDSKMYMFGDSGQIGAAGCLVQSKTNKPSSDGVIIYFSCEDVSIESNCIVEAGGKILFPKTNIGEFGYISQFIDTEGNRMGLHSNK